MMNNEEDFTGPVNIGNPSEFTIRELADLVVRLTGQSIQFVNKPLPMDDPRQRRPDITLAKQKLNWEPNITLEEGLRKTIEWFRSIDFEQYRPPTPLY
jgi:UDP-glucuronate decarboxylase